VIFKNAKTGAFIISSNPFNHRQEFLYFVSHLLPKLTSPLTSAALTTKQYNKIESEFHPSVIAAMGYNHTWPNALRYGTHQYGGLQMKSLEVEALIKQNQCLRSLMNKDKTHKLILIMFSWYQYISGTFFPILEQNNQPTQHLNSVWITDFIRLLNKFNVQLKLRKKNIRKHQR